MTGDGDGVGSPVEPVETREGWALRGASSGLAEAPFCTAVPTPYAAASASSEVTPAVATTRFQVIEGASFGRAARGSSPTRQW